MKFKLIGKNNLPYNHIAGMLDHQYLRKEKFCRSYFWLGLARRGVDVSCVPLVFLEGMARLKIVPNEKLILNETKVFFL